MRLLERSGLQLLGRGCTPILSPLSRPTQFAGRFVSRRGSQQRIPLLRAGRDRVRFDPLCDTDSRFQRHV